MYRIPGCYSSGSALERGADEITLLHLYRSLVRSKLDYGCIIYGSAKSSYIKALNAIHHQRLRLCLFAFRTSPVDSLYVEANEPPLDLRRLKLTLQYIVKLKANIDNPAYNCVFHPLCESLHDKNKKCIKSIRFGVQKHVEDSDLHYILYIFLILLKYHHGN